ncbi:lysine/arginine permease Can1p [Diutina catenulata]
MVFHIQTPQPDEINVPMSVLELGSVTSRTEGTSSGVEPHASRFTHESKKNIDYVSDKDFEVEDDNNGFKNTEVKRDLKPRQISMIALGGTIGTGLFISTGDTLSKAGPVSSLISFLFMTTLVFCVTQALGEMATYIPITGSFTQFVARWCSPALGAANGYNYWFSWAITYSLELSIVGQVIQYWTDAVPLAAWISIFFVIIPIFNMFPVKYYGEFEFWIASIKVIAVVGWIIYALCIMCGAGKTGPIGFRYWRNPGPWGPGYLVEDVATGRFLGWLKSLISATFTFQGCETVGIAAGESKNPRSALPSAIRKVLFRILIFYVLCMFFIGVLVPYDDPQLDGSDTANSPFIIAMNNAGTKVLPHIFNAVILTTVISAANSNVFIASRILYALAESKVAPKPFMWTTRWGVPWFSVAFTSAIGALGYLAVSNSGQEAFDWLLNISALAGLISWGGIAFAHIRFMQILKHRGISRDSLPFKAKFMPYGTYYAFTCIFILVFVQGFDCFWDITAAKFFTAYISLVLFVFCWVVFHFVFNGFGKKAWQWRNFITPIDECDIDTGARDFDDSEWDEEQPPNNLWEKFWNIVS